jgi:hypothetical protein
LGPPTWSFPARLRAMARGPPRDEISGSTVRPA